MWVGLMIHCSFITHSVTLPLFPYHIQSHSHKLSSSIFHYYYCVVGKQTNSDIFTEILPKIVINYIHHISHAIATVLGNLDILVSFHLHHTLHHLLVQVKDVVPVESRNGVIYKIPCKDCHVHNMLCMNKQSL